TEEVIEGLEFVLVELPKFKPEEWTDRRMAVLWLRFLKEVEERRNDVSEDLKANADISRALEMCEVGAFTEAELAAYDKYWDIIRTENALLAESKAAGIAEGRAEGLAEGEAKSLITVVRNCKSNGISLEQIRMITGLDEGRILEILRSNNE
ncbi:MAG: Rpn family recombination-promoting nuclease/putative transposase, partial [Dysgonamonadaceae bacterium]|nr:Rpn family recombination-promoting nuclease/putative transposase [Dysgonamonadaceae bacterium]